MASKFKARYSIQKQIKISVSKTKLLNAVWRITMPQLKILATILKSTQATIAIIQIIGAFVAKVLEFTENLLK